jgi:O-acetyl-ADP-ribose deacetylase (regulator of RNase III)
MITEAHGDLLSADVEAVINTVNTVGVMGKGIALQFKSAYPANFRAYRAACARGDVKLGEMFVFDAGQLVRPRWIINFPTKGHWKSKSKLRDIEVGLDDLHRVIIELKIGSVAVPPLGCGNGGLRWSDVRPLIERKLGDLDATVVVFPPEGAPAAAEIRHETPRPRMTRARAALIDLLDAYAAPALGATLVEAQKLMYFLQETGEPLELRFAKGSYGPYADNLRHLLITLEGHQLSGFGDGSKSVTAAEPLHVLNGAAEEAKQALEAADETRERIERVRELVEGFESAYGLELLATVHWAATRDVTTELDEEVVAVVTQWNSRKARLFPEERVRLALDHLRELGWLGRGALPRLSSQLV